MSHILAENNNQNKRSRSSSSTNPSIEKENNTLAADYELLQWKHDQCKKLYYSTEGLLKTEKATRAKIEEKHRQTNEQLQQITQLHDHCHDSRADLERSNAKCRSLEVELQELKNKIGRLYHSCNELKKAHEQSQTKCHSLEDKLKRMTDQLEQVTLESSAIVSIPINGTAELMNMMTFTKPCCSNPHPSLGCLPQQQQSHDFLLQEIERLKKELRRQVITQPLSHESGMEYPPLFNAGMIGCHPCGSLDEEAMRIRDYAVALEPHMTNEWFDTAAIDYNISVFRRRIGTDKAFELVLFQLEEDFVSMSSSAQEEIAFSIIICAARAIVCLPRAKDDSLERIDSSIRESAKRMIRGAKNFIRCPYTAEQFNKLFDVLRVGTTVLSNTNKCPTWKGWSAAYGGMGPPDGDCMECLSMRVYVAINDCFGNNLSSYLFGTDNHESGGFNFRPACTHEAPPHGSYRHCRDPTVDEFATMTELFKIAMTFAIAAGVNWFAICCAGSADEVLPKYINRLEVDESLTTDLLLNDIQPGLLAVVPGTAHLSYLAKFNSTNANMQCENACDFIRLIANSLSTFLGDAQAGQRFFERAIANKELVFVTENPDKINELNEMNAREIKAKADGQKKKQLTWETKRLLEQERLANRTIDEIMQDEEKKEEARLDKNAKQQARNASRTAEEKAEENAARRDKYASRSAEEIEEARLNNNARQARYANARYANEMQMFHCGHCGGTFESGGQGTINKCQKEMNGLKCNQTCQNTKLVEGETWRCRNERYKKPNSDYYNSLYCGRHKCVTDNQKKNWFRVHSELDI